MDFWIGIAAGAVTVVAGIRGTTGGGSIEDSMNQHVGARDMAPHGVFHHRGVAGTAAWSDRGLDRDDDRR